MRFKLNTIVFSLIIVAVLAGCSSKPSVPKVETTDKFYIEEIDLAFSQSRESEILYHTETEIREMIISRIKEQIEKANLMSNDKSMNSLVIKMDYTRRFMGDATPFPADSLALAQYNYTIEVMDQDKLLATISRKDLVYDGGIAMNLKLVAGQLREKEDEIPLIEALANAVVKSIIEFKER